MKEKHPWPRQDRSDSSLSLCSIFSPHNWTHRTSLFSSFPILLGSLWLLPLFPSLPSALLALTPQCSLNIPCIFFNISLQVSFASLKCYPPLCYWRILLEHKFGHIIFHMKPASGFPVPTGLGLTLQHPVPVYLPPPPPTQPAPGPPTLPWIRWAYSFKAPCALHFCCVVIIAHSLRSVCPARQWGACPLWVTRHLAYPQQEGLLPACTPDDKWALDLVYGMTCCVPFNIVKSDSEVGFCFVLFF